MPTDPDQPGGSHDPTRAQDPIDPTRVQPGVDPTRVGDPAYARPEPRRTPVVDEPLRRDPRDDDDRNGAWWLWGLLAAVLIAIVLFALLQEGDDDDDAVGTADPAETEPGAVETAPEDTTADTTAETAPADTTPADDDAVTDDTTATSAPADGGAAPDGAGEDPGTVTTTDGTDLISLVQGDAGDAERLAPYADQDVTGEGVYVLDVVDGEGFWIGADDQQRIFAHAADDVAVEVGQRISFDGFLKPNPPDDSAEVHDIPEDQGAELHRQQGHHIELRSLMPA